jgi:hypothetical protein
MMLAVNFGTPNESVHTGIIIPGICQDFKSVFIVIIRSAELFSTSSSTFKGFCSTINDNVSIILGIHRPIRHKAGILSPSVV